MFYPQCSSEFIDIVMLSANVHVECAAILVVSLNKLRYMHCPITAIFRVYRKRMGVQVYSIVLLDNSLHYHVADLSLILLFLLHKFMQFTEPELYPSSNLNNWEIALCENYNCELILREDIDPR